MIPASYLFKQVMRDRWSEPTRPAQTPASGRHPGLTRLFHFPVRPREGWGKGWH
jgi:hypothetical protein